MIFTETSHTLRTLIPRNLSTEQAFEKLEKLEKFNIVYRSKTFFPHKVGGTSVLVNLAGKATNKRFHLFMCFKICLECLSLLVQRFHILSFNEFSVSMVFSDVD